MRLGSGVREVVVGGGRAHRGLRGQRRGMGGECPSEVPARPLASGLTWKRPWPESGDGNEGQEMRQFGSLAFSTLSPPLNPEAVT